MKRAAINNIVLLRAESRQTNKSPKDDRAAVTMNPQNTEKEMKKANTVAGADAKRRAKAAKLRTKAAKIRMQVNRYERKIVALHRKIADIERKALILSGHAKR